MKKLFLFLMGAFLVLGLCSCNDNTQNEPINNNVSSYIGLDISVTNTKLDSGNIEDTVENIYDSVVAIESYYNGTHTGSGSGVVFGKTDSMSFIVTCHHVIEGCNGFDVIFSNGEVASAILIGGDDKSDVAVLAVDKVDLCYVSWFDNTDELRLGSTVICIGNPLGTLPGSVSTGVVSYNNRVIKVDDYNNMTLIQTDVAINSGNSGGGLFNSAGALIGIVNAKYSSSGIEGLGFAIPANQAKTIVTQILETALYNEEENSWITGYVEGRWNLGFTLGYGGYGFYRTVIGVAESASNETSSDYGLLFSNDTINSIVIKYSDSSKESKELLNISAQTMTIEYVYSFIYSAELSLGDSLIFNITRGNDTLDVEVELIQYRYYL